MIDHIDQIRFIIHCILIAAALVKQIALNGQTHSAKFACACLQNTN